MANSLQQKLCRQPALWILEIWVESKELHNRIASHGSISYGHIGADLISLASLPRIPVAMHNVAEEQIFHPGTWSLCGVLEPQDAAYRACTTFSSLYG
jgi:hypothetical protein